MAPITLLTDFGTSDTYVGQMKGVIACLAPEAPIIDLTHEVPPQYLIAGAIALDSAIDAFPRGTVHVAVVDPGVGGARRPIAARSDRFTLVGPDNGLFTIAWQRYPPREIIALTNPDYHRTPVSDTFHGRDIFAPAAAHLAAGIALSALGEPLNDPARLEMPTPEQHDDVIELQVLTVDHFGNLITNMTTQALSALQAPDRASIIVGRSRIAGIHRTFADVAEGDPVAYLGSSGYLEIAIRNGNAAQHWQIRAGETIQLHLSQ